MSSHCQVQTSSLSQPQSEEILSNINSALALNLKSLEQLLERSNLIVSSALFEQLANLDLLRNSFREEAVDVLTSWGCLSECVFFEKDVFSLATAISHCECPEPVAVQFSPKTFKSVEASMSMAGVKCFYNRATQNTICLNSLEPLQTSLAQVDLPGVPQEDVEWLGLLKTEIEGQTVEGWQVFLASILLAQILFCCCVCCWANKKVARA